MWQDGTALYFILRVPEFSWPGVSEHIYRHGYLIAALTWATVFFQLTFPPLMLSRSWRLPALLAATTFHLGIAVLMNLWTFSIIMIATEATFLQNDHYDRLRKFLDRRIPIHRHTGSGSPPSVIRKEGFTA